MKGSGRGQAFDRGRGDPGMKCLLCDAEGVQLLESVSTRELVDDWKRFLDVTVDEPIPAPEIHLYHCVRCDVSFFVPPWTGSGGFYSQLQKFDWYYGKKKWEHDVAIREISRGSRVLEIGCGEGAFVERMNTERLADAVGIELNATAVEAARACQRPVTPGSWELLKGKNSGAYDVVCCFQVLEHVAEPRAFIETCLDLLRPGGRWIVTTPNSRSFLKYTRNILDGPPHHVTRWSEKCFRTLAVAKGLRDVTIRFEPLARGHIDYWLEAQERRFRGRLAGRILSRPWLADLARGVLQCGSCRRLIQGQGLYLSATKG